MTTTKLLFLIGVLLLVATATAVPTMSPVAGGDVNNKQVVFHATNGVAPCWFSWGYGTNLYWTTPNQSATGDFTDTQYGSPMLTGESYMVTACVSTGCDLTPEAFTVPTATVIKQTNFGADIMAIMRSGFNTTVVASYILVPYALIMSDSSSSVSSGAASIVWGIFFMFIFVGYWLRGKGIMLPAILAIMSGTLLISTTNSISPIAVAPIFTSMGLPLLIIGIAGVATSWFSNR